MKKIFSIVIITTILIIGIILSIHYFYSSNNITYNQVINNPENKFLNKTITWQGVISKHSALDGIKFNIVDSEHPYGSWADYEWFWALPKMKDIEGQVIGQWTTFTLNKYGNFDTYSINDIFLVKGKIINLDCNYYDYTMFNKKVCLPNIEIISFKKYE